jgi:hypothetical protein
MAKAVNAIVNAIWAGLPIFFGSVRRLLQDITAFF